MVLTWCNQVKGEEGVYALGDIADCRDALMDEAAATAQVGLLCVVPY
jgi:NADH dehydrogenase FAD-containing subunit